MRRSKANHGKRPNMGAAEHRAARPSPPAPARDDVVDVLHGVEVADPYRWLEDGDAAEVAAWVAAQNERTRQALDARPDRQGVARAPRRAAGAARSRPACRLAGDRVFALERGGGQKQFVLVVRSAVDPRRRPASCSIRPSSGGRRRRGHRLVPPVARRSASSPTASPRAATSAACCGSSTSRPAATARRDPRHPGGLGGLAPRRQRLPLHPLSGGRRVPPDGSTATARRAAGPTTSWCGTSCRPGDRGPTSPSRPTAAARSCTSLGRLGPHRRPPPRPPTGDVADADRGRRRRHRRSLRRRPAGRPHHARRARGAGSWPSPSTVPCRPSSGRPSCPRATACVERAEPVARRAARRVHRPRRRPACTATIADGASLGEVALPELGSVAGLRCRPTRRWPSASSSPSPARPACSGGRRRRAGAARRARRRGGGGSSVDVRRPRRSATASLDGTEIGLFLVHRADVTPDADTPCILTGYGGFAIAETPAWSPAIAAWCEAGRPLRRRRAAGRLRGGRGVAPGRAAASTSRTSSTTSPPPPTTSWRPARTSPRPAGHPRRLQRRPARRRRAHAAPRPVPGRALRRAAARHGALPAVPHRPAVDRRVRRPRRGRGVRLAARPTRRTTTSRRAPATRRCCSPRPRATPGSTRSTPARWPPRCSAATPARTSARSCSTRRAGPVTARASRCTSRPTSWPTCWPSSPGSSGVEGLARDHDRRARPRRRPDGVAGVGFAVDEPAVRPGRARPPPLRPGAGAAGSAAWMLAGAPDEAVADVDGLPTGTASHRAPEAAGRRTRSVPRSSTTSCVRDARPRPHRRAVERALGLPLRRTRDGDADGRPMRQAFFRMGEVILEVVGPPSPTRRRAGPRSSASRSRSADLDAAVASSAILGEAQGGVQPGRSIATVRRPPGWACRWR